MSAIKTMNSNLHKAKKAKNDEFYTQLSDIEKELVHYKNHFKDKIVYCNCDDPYLSNFVKYFAYNFHFLGLKKLTASCYVSKDSPSDRAISWEFNGEFKDNNPVLDSAIVTELDGDGDFRSSECIELLKEADIVVTNPPFSLFREYVAQLIEHKKDFLIIGNQNAITYKEIFPLLKDSEMWLGVNNSSIEFEVVGNLIDRKNVYYNKSSDKWMSKFGNISWFTNLEHHVRNEWLVLSKKYSKGKYPKYDNYNAINVDRVVNIPCDYDGVMGVPITFLNKYNPAQFEIVWQASGNTRVSAPKKILQKLKYIAHPEDRGGCGVILGNRKYSRVFIKNKVK